MTTRSLVVIAALVGILALVGALLWQRNSVKRVRTAPGQCHGCNLVLISIDSLRRDHMSLYGYARKTTPAIDEWAKTGLVFENYFAAGYLTPISEAAVHSGLYPEVNGITSFRRQFGDDVKPLAEFLREHGYRTAGIGTSPEFENFPSLRASFVRGFDHFRFPKSRLESNRTPSWPLLRQFVSENSTKPFFLWLALGDVHAPFGARAENKFADPKYNGPFAELKFFTNMQFYYDRMFYDPFDPLKAFRVVAWRGSSVDMHYGSPEKFKHLKFPLRATDRDLSYIRDLYDNGVAEADREVQRFLNLLKSRGLLDNTVVILQSEHGESLGEHGYVAHYDIHEESVRVPLVIAGPGVAAGRTEAMASGVDVMPTALSLLGLDSRKLPYTLDGQPLLTTDGLAGPGREHVFLTRTPLWESIIHAKGENAIFDRFRALDDEIGFKDHGIRTRTHKLIHRTARLAEERFSCWKFVSGKTKTRSEFEFYDLVADPGELKAQTPNGEHAQTLANELARWKADVAGRARITPQTPIVQDYQ